MSLTGGIVVFAVAWFLSLYAILPFGMRSQEEAGEVEPGTPASAPSEPRIRRKMLWATVSAVIIWIGVFLFLESGAVTVADLAALFSRPK